MDTRIVSLKAVSLVAIVATTGCAGMDAVISTPSVALTSVEMPHIDFDRQTCLLGFDVSNPNPFPLRVRSVRYRVRLGDQHFASGETPGGFTVPSNGDGEFTISAELNLFRTTSAISTLIRTGIRRQMDYELSGSLTVDIPYAKPLEFSSSGSIELLAARVLGE
ncbi:MAG: LEA type 2 family protein [Woeseia sp.]